MTVSPNTPAQPYPPVAAVLSRLREVLGPETVDSFGKPVGLERASAEGVGMVRWWVAGVALDTGVAVRMSTGATEPGEPTVLWVTRPGEAKAERCPIVTMEHLQGFLALLSIARRSPEPVRGHVCPGDS
jgi:hypothetical protein